MFLLELHPNKLPARAHAFHHFQVSSLCVKEMYIEFILKIETSQQKKTYENTGSSSKTKISQQIQARTWGCRKESRESCRAADNKILQFDFQYKELRCGEVIPLNLAG